MHLPEEEALLLTRVGILGDYVAGPLEDSWPEVDAIKAACCVCSGLCGWLRACKL